MRVGRAFLVPVALGVLLAPVVVVLGAHAAITAAGMLAAAAVSGIAVARRDRDTSREVALAAVGGLAVPVVAYAIAGRVWTSSPFGILAMIPATWWWLALAACAGAGGGLLKASRGGRSALPVVAAAALVVLAAGWAVGWARASDTLVSEDPCRGTDGMSAACQVYVSCPEMAERRRFGAFERVTAFDPAAGRVRCEYITWGGLLVGTVDADRTGSHWTSGPFGP